MAHFSGLVAPACTRTRSRTSATSSPRRRTRRSPGPRSGFVALHATELAQASTAPSSPASRAARSVTSPRRRPWCFAIAAHPGLPPGTPAQGGGRTSKALAEGLPRRGEQSLTGGTDTHLILLDLRGSELTGKAGRGAARRDRMTVNRNTVPFDERPPTVASGVRSDAGGDDARPRRGGCREVGRSSHASAAPELRRWRAHPARSSAPPALPGLAPGFPARECCGPKGPRSSSSSTTRAIRAKITQIRDANDGRPSTFRRPWVDEVALLLYLRGDPRSLPARRSEVQTPLERARRASGDPAVARRRSCPCCAPDSGCSTRVLALIPAARVGFLGVYRDEETLTAVPYYAKLPFQIEGGDALLLDPMLATGGSASHSITRLQGGRRPRRAPALPDRRAGGHRARAWPSTPTS